MATPKTGTFWFNEPGGRAYESEAAALYAEAAVRLDSIAMDALLTALKSGGVSDPVAQNIVKFVMENKQMMRQLLEAEARGGAPK